MAKSARFEGRRIYVTGAASGIGRATAHILAAEGAKVALVDVNGVGLAETAAATGGEAFTLDVRDGAAVDRSVAEAAARFGGLDGVVNCAGVGVNAPLPQLTTEIWEHVLAVNLTAPYRISRAALPWLKQSPAASIVNVSSGAGLLPTSPGTGAYSASKAGLLGLTKALALELAPAIRVNAVCPGITRTGMMADMLGENPDEAPFVQLYAIKRTAAPSEIANTIVFLLSEEASFVTGAVLAADGGRTFH